MDRRVVLKAGGVAVASAGALAFLFTDRPSRAERSAPSKQTGLKRDPRGLLDLPEGFEYWIVERALDPMSDGYRMPAMPDGMGCFPGPGGSLVLMRNHELDYHRMLSAFPGEVPPEAYDAKVAGGVSRVVVDPTARRRVSSNMVLAGTARNCAGGVSPWGWITCEETTEPGHGYAFVCRADAERLEASRPIKGFGRFQHEAACVDPQTLITYLTEDQGDGCLYRFVPSQKSKPFHGQLQALAIVGRPGLNLTSGLPAETVEVEWKVIDEPDPATDSVRYQGHQKGAAKVARGEGIWFAHNRVYFCSTSGGRAGSGQIFVLHPGRGKAPDRLELLVESPGSTRLDMPDNITVASWGDVFMAEDGYTGSQYLRAVTPEGRLYDVARNAVSAGEFAGVCFSPDERTLFCNLQSDGLTLAIVGPFENLRKRA